jgi:hypothetical protein
MTTKPEERHAQLELCIPYVFGRLNPGNRKQFEAHLTSGCEQCIRELSGLYEATALLPLLLRQEMPPSGLRQRILSRASSRKPEPQRAERPSTQRESPVTPATRPEFPWYRYAATVLGILMILALAYFVYELVGTTANQDKKITELQAKIKQNDEALTILEARQLEIVSLAGVEPGSNFYGKILWDASSRNAVLQIAGLPAAADGKCYQLWMQKEKKYFAIAQFDMDRGQAGIFKTLTIPVGEKGAIEGFTVTLEPKDGSTQPSGTIFLRGAR